MMSGDARTWTAKSSGRFLVPLPLGIAPVIVYSILCQRITPFAAIPTPLRFDIAVVAALGGVAVGSWARSQREWALLAPFGISGALLGAADRRAV